MLEANLLQTEAALLARGRPDRHTVIGPLPIRQTGSKKPLFEQGLAFDFSLLERNSIVQ